MPQKRWSPLFAESFCMTFLTSGRGPGYWDLTPWALLSTTSSGTFRKAAPKMSVPRSSFLLQTVPGIVFFFSGQNCRVLLVGQHASMWNSVCFPPWCHENASMFFKKLTARKQVSATKMLEIRAETATRNGSLAKDFPFHLFFVNVPRLKKVENV